MNTMNDDTKAAAITACPVGCAMILDIFGNSNLPLEYFADPLTSFWLLSHAVNICDIHAESNTQQLALEHAADHADIARAIVRNPAFAWWYEPIDASAQVWLPHRRPYENALLPNQLDSFEPGSWRPPHSPRLVPNTILQTTSTLKGTTTSDVTAYALYSADHIAEFPLAAWRITFRQEVKVWEINHPSDWHRLCTIYPAHCEDGRLIPDWPSIAADWDGVHISVGGVLSCDQVRFEQDGEWSMLNFWHSEHTQWLRRLDIAGERMGDFQREFYRVNLARYPYPGFRLD